MSAERFLASTGIAAVHVPFKGSPEAITEVMAGRVDFYFSPVGLVVEYIRERKLLALAVNSPRRAAILPEVPTLAEAGVSDAEYPLWYGSFVPARTPRHIVETLHRETSKALKTPNVETKLATLGPSRVKHFQAIHHFSVDVAHGLAQADGHDLDRVRCACQSRDSHQCGPHQRGRYQINRRSMARFRDQHLIDQAVTDPLKEVGT
jgi:hypothetical protein